MKRVLPQECECKGRRSSVSRGKHSSVGRWWLRHRGDSEHV